MRNASAFAIERNQTILLFEFINMHFVMKKAPVSGGLMDRCFCDAAYFIVGMTNSAPSLMPDGHREVTVLTLV